jgi:uncharacterized membrane protein
LHLDLATRPGAGPGARVRPEGQNPPVPIRFEGEGSMATAQTIRATEQAARDYHEAASAPEINVGDTERLASKVGGGVLIAAGLMKGGLKGLVMAGLGGMLVHRGMTGHCSLYGAMGANSAEVNRGPLNAVPAQHGIRVEEAVVIDAPPERLYDFWRDPANLSRFIPNVHSVTEVGGNPDLQHWVAQGPLGATAEWDAEIHNDDAGRLIAWRSLDGGDLATAGSVHFLPSPGGKGTEVRVNQKFDLPGGKLGVAAARLAGYDPAAMTRQALTQLKQIVETGQVAGV